MLQSSHATWILIACLMPARACACAVVPRIPHSVAARLVWACVLWLVRWHIRLVICVRVCLCARMVRLSVYYVRAGGTLALTPLMAPCMWVVYVPLPPGSFGGWVLAKGVVCFDSLH